MRKIKKMVKAIDEEIEGAKTYAEQYLDCKAKDNSQWANKYKEMANDELKHAMYLHDFAVHEIEELSKVYTPPVEMQKKWDESHKKYIEEVAWIKQMLTL